MQDPPPPMGETPDRGSIAPDCNPKGSSSQQDDDSQGGQIIRSMDDLPEGIYRRIHARMPLRDAARLACVSHTFRRSWRCYPKLDLHQETLGLNGDLISKVDHILKNHSGVGLKKLWLELSNCDKVESCYISSWLRIAFTAGIEELSLFLPHIPDEEENYFPCSPLFNGSENSIRYLDIGISAFRPTAGFGHWRSLTRLFLSNVRIADDELEGLLHSCAALEHLGILNCPEIVCLKIPCLLQRLRLLVVCLCRNLQVIDSNAPNISIFHFSGSLAWISFGSALQVKNVEMDCLESGQSNIVLHARTKLLSYAPNVETLAISSPNEVRQPYMEYDSVIEDSSHLRWLPQQRHNSLKSLTIVGFCSAKSLVELTCHIVENATSLESLTLDTTHGCQSSGGCSIDKLNRWFYTGKGILMARPHLNDASLWGRISSWSLTGRFWLSEDMLSRRFPPESC